MNLWAQLRHTRWREAVSAFAILALLPAVVPLSGCRSAKPAVTAPAPSSGPAAASTSPPVNEQQVAAEIAMLHQRRIKEPRNAGILIDLGRRYSLVGHSRDALAAFEDAAALDPKAVPAFLGQGQVWRELGRPGKAVQAYERANKLFPDQALIELELAGAYIDLRDFPTAQEHAVRASELDPYNPEVFRALGTAYAALGDIPRTLETGKKAISLAPDDPSNWVQMGALCYGVRRFPEAVNYLRKAVQMSPQNVDANVNLADALRQVDQAEGNRKETQALLARALVLDPFHDRALFLLGRMYLEDGKVDLAVSTLRRAVRWAPRSKEALLALGQALARQGAKVEAQALIARAQSAMDTTVDFRGLEFQASSNPNPNVYARLVELYIRGNLYDSAMYAVDKGLKSSPRDPRLMALRKTLLEKAPKIGGASGL